MASSRQILNARRKVIEARDQLRDAESISAGACKDEFHDAYRGIDILDTALTSSAGKALAKEDDEAPRAG